MERREREAQLAGKLIARAGQHGQQLCRSGCRAE
jgi:hypothetical protein